MVLRGAQFQRSGPAGCALLTRRVPLSYTDKFERQVCAVACNTIIVSLPRKQTQQYCSGACLRAEGKLPWSFSKGLASDGARG